VENPAADRPGAEEIWLGQEGDGWQEAGDFRAAYRYQLWAVSQDKTTT
jgi:hypothetical protein